jgi:hypothetical protein
MTIGGNVMQFYTHAYKADAGNGQTTANVDISGDNEVHIVLRWATVRMVLDLDPGEALALGRQLTRSAEHALDAREIE